MKVSTELLVATRHRRDMTEKLLKEQTTTTTNASKTRFQWDSFLLFSFAKRPQGEYGGLSLCYTGVGFFYGQACASETLSDTLSSTGCVIFTPITQSASKSANM